MFVDGVRVRRFRGQSETSIAVSGSNMLTTWNDATGFFVSQKGLSGVGYSLNGGQSFCDGRGFKNPLFPTRVPIGDNSTAADNQGNFFTAYLYDTPEVGVAPTSAIGVTRVRFSALPSTCPNPTNATTQVADDAGLDNIGDDPVVAIASATDFLDKEWLAIDPNPVTVNGQAVQPMYTCYTRFIGLLGGLTGVGVGSGQVELIRSLDGGQTWNGTLPPGVAGGPVIVQPDQSISSPSPLNPIVNTGCYVAVGPSHQVYVVWENNWLSSNTPDIRFAKSLDLGETFSTPSEIATFNSLAFSPPAGYDRSTINDFPKIAVDLSPFSAKQGSLYVTWQASPQVGSPLADILVAISRDGGNTWQAPIVVNSDTPGTNLHFFPAISVDSFGNVNAIFYDRRNHPFTPGVTNDSGLTDLFAAHIPVIGTKIVNWQINSVTSAWLSARSNITPNFGDYIQGVSSGDVLFSSWADSRNDNTPSPFFAASDTKAIASTTK